MQETGLTTVPALLESRCRARPDAPMLYYRDQVISYAEAAQAVDRLTGYLAARGIGAGDRVAFWLPSVPAYLLLFLATARLGAIAVAINTRYRATEVGDILERSGATALVLWPGFRRIDFTAILAGVPAEQLAAVKTVIVYDEEGEVGNAPALPGRIIERYRTVLAHPPAATDLSAAELGCNIFTTSGTTSKPKLVLHHQRAISGHAFEVARYFGLYAADSVTLQVLPLCGVFGFCQAMASLAAGCPIVMTPAFDAIEAVDLCRRYRVTQFNATDDMMDAIVRAANNKPLESIDFVGFAAFNRSHEHLVERANELGIRMVGVWGMSETQALVARRDAGSPVEERERAGGRLASEHAAVRLRDPDSGELLGVGDTGALEISAPSLMAGYFGNPEATAAAFTDDGFFRTGDLAMLEAGGGFEYLSRLDDSLRLSGFLVNPAEIDAEVSACTGVEAAQTVEVLADGQSRPLTFVTLSDADAFDEAAVLARCAERLARFKCPLRVVPLPSFPVADSANGLKIQRSRLRQLASEIVTKTAD